MGSKYRTYKDTKLPIDLNRIFAWNGIFGRTSSGYISTVIYQDQGKAEKEVIFMEGPGEGTHSP